MGIRTQGFDVSGVATRPEEFEAFYREHLPFVRRYVARRLADPGDVADVTADIFLRVVRSAASYQAGFGPPQAWLAGIARNAVADHHRAGSQHEAAVRQLAGRRWLDEDSAERIVQRVSAEATARTMLGLIADLPAPLRAVVELVAVDGLTVADAAGVLGISAGAARVRYHRARRQLNAAPAFQREVMS